MIKNQNDNNQNQKLLKNSMKSIQQMIINDFKSIYTLSLSVSANKLYPIANFVKINHIDDKNDNYQMIYYNANRLNGDLGVNNLNNPCKILKNEE